MKIEEIIELRKNLFEHIENLEQLSINIGLAGNDEKAWMKVYDEWSENREIANAYISEIFRVIVRLNANQK